MSVVASGFHYNQIRNHSWFNLFNQLTTVSKQLSHVLIHVHILGWYVSLQPHWNFVDKSEDASLGAFTCIEFSCRLRYRVLTEILCGTSSSPFLVQITRLAWLEQLQGAGHGGVASASWGPLKYGHNKSWTNQMRGKGLQRPVNMGAHMANESCPSPLFQKIWFISTGMAGGVDNF